MSQFSNLTPEFRDALRAMADKMVEKVVVVEQQPAVVVKVALEQEPEVVEIDEEGSSAPTDK